MKRFLGKIIDFFDYFFYKATKTQVFDKELEVKLFGARCILSFLLYSMTGIIIWPILGMFTDVMTVRTIDIIIIIWLISLLFLTRFRYSDVKLYYRLKEKYQNESHPVLKGILLILLFLAFFMISYMLM